VHAEGFPDQAPQAIAVDRVARGARADGHAEPRTRAVARRPLHDELLIREALAALARALELGGGVKLVTRPQSVTPGRTSLVSDVR
jgi:hypothetical protein